MILTMTERCDRLDAAIAEDRLLRNKWRESNGKEYVCLLAALSPECAESERVSACPCDVCPQWWAELTPWIDDNGTAKAWPAMIRRYASLARRWHVLKPESWGRLERQVKIICIDEALSHVTVDDWGVREACEQIKDILRTGRGDVSAARAAARAAADAARVASYATAGAARAAAYAAGATAYAARAAAYAAAEAARAAADAARVAADAARAAAGAARAAAYAAAGAARVAAYAAGATAYAARAAADAARAAADAAADAARAAARAAAYAAADHITLAIFDAMETAIVECERTAL